MSINWQKIEWGKFTGIPEEWVWDAVPKGGFIEAYVRWGEAATDCHVAYHLNNCLAVLATAAPKTLTFPFGEPVYTNWFALVVARSADSRKTHAIRMANRLLRESAPERMEEQEPVSKEALEELLVERPQVLIQFPDFATFLSASQGGQKAAMRESLLSIWDCTTIRRRSMKAKNAGKAPPTQYDPRLSIMAAITPEHLESMTTILDWSGGFVSRFCILYAERIRKREMAEAQDETRNGLCAYLQAVADEYGGGIGLGASKPTPVGPCLGFSPEAKKIYSEWQKNVHRAGAFERMASALGRAHTIALKAATLMAFDRMLSCNSIRAGEPWYVLPEDVTPAINLADLHLVSVAFLSQTISDNADGRLMSRMAKFVGQRVATFADLLNFVEIPELRAKQLLNTLVSRERLVECSFDPQTGRVGPPMSTPDPASQTKQAYVAFGSEHHQALGQSTGKPIDLLAVLNKAGNTIIPVPEPAKLNGHAHPAAEMDPDDLAWSSDEDTNS